MRRNRVPHFNDHELVQPFLILKNLTRPATLRLFNEGNDRHQELMETGSPPSLASNLLIRVTLIECWRNVPLEILDFVTRVTLLCQDCRASKVSEGYPQRLHHHVPTGECDLCAIRRLA